MQGLPGSLALRAKRALKGLRLLRHLLHNNPGKQLSRLYTCTSKAGAHYPPCSASSCALQFQHWNPPCGCTRILRILAYSFHPCPVHT
jgi:hypothetical protein